MDSIERAVREVLTSEDFIRDIADKIRTRVLVRYDDETVSTLMFDAAKFDVLEHMVNGLLAKNVDAITIRGITFE